MVAGPTPLGSSLATEVPADDVVHEEHLVEAEPKHVVLADIGNVCGHGTAPDPPRHDSSPTLCGVFEIEPGHGCFHAHPTRWNDELHRLLGQPLRRSAVDSDVWVDGEYPARQDRSKSNRNCSHDVSVGNCGCADMTALDDRHQSGQSSLDGGDS